MRHYMMSTDRLIETKFKIMIDSMQMVRYLSKRRIDDKKNMIR